MKPWKLYAALIAFVLVFGGGMALGWRLFRPADVKREVTANVILSALKDRGFLVTQTYVFDEPVTIKKTSGSAFKDFFFGQTITARGAMEVNLGVDLTRVTSDQVSIKDNAITVLIPAVTVFNVRLVGPIDVNNEQGLLKRILENDDGYNEALSELSRIAEETAKKPEFIQRATARGREEIARLLGTVAQGKDVQVNVNVGY